LEHLLRTTGASVLVTRARHGGRDMREVVARLRTAGVGLGRHWVIEGELAERDSIEVEVEVEVEGTAPDPSRDPDERRLGPDEVFFVNSTSGTTGLPKCVIHDQRRWMSFHELAVGAGELTPDDVFMSLLPAPFGFGLWTAHFTPTLLGAPVVRMARFAADEALALIERCRVSVLAAVSTQFILMLESQAMDERDLSSLRVLFTGGEAVPYERAAAFEERTGAAVLQFYGSNETGAVSGTTLADSRERRLRTAGRVIPEMNVRLFDGQGRDVTHTGRGQPGCKGPTLSRGYWGDEAANRELVRPDGWMLLGDIVEIDAQGYLQVVGRTDDFIIRGGKNISALAVEEQVATHPAVALAAAVAMPDAIFGERVCVYVELRPGGALDLLALVRHLETRDVSKEYLPERLVVVDELPRGSGGKVAKGRLREDIRQRLALEGGSSDPPSIVSPGDRRAARAEGGTSR
ncbi:MAG: class I adenylate-forming enzyme family protein, partial [Myxococcota bacterium]